MKHLVEVKGIVEIEAETKDQAENRAAHALADSPLKFLSILAVRAREEQLIAPDSGLLGQRGTM